MTLDEAESDWDSESATRYVRVTGVLKNSFVEFDFSFDDPSIFIELVLPFSQFKSFCARHNAQELTPEQQLKFDRMQAEREHRWKERGKRFHGPWRHGDDT